MVIHKGKEMLVIMVDGKRYRTEEYKYKNCSEIIVRGDFPNGCFKSSGQPVFIHGNVTYFKVKYTLDGAIGMPTDGKKSKKKWATDNPNPEDWEPFFEAWHEKKFKGKVPA